MPLDVDSPEAAAHIGRASMAERAAAAAHIGRASTVEQAAAAAHIEKASMAEQAAADSFPVTAKNYFYWTLLAVMRPDSHLHWAQQTMVAVFYSCLKGPQS